MKPPIHPIQQPVLMALSPDRPIQVARVHGLMVFAKAGKLIVRGPKRAAPDLIQTLLDRKADLLPLLQHWDTDAWERFQERVSIMRADGGAMQHEAELFAWDEIQDSQPMHQ
jgi:hypothetical protein